MKRIPFLPKIIYIGMRGWTTGRSFQNVPSKLPMLTSNDTIKFCQIQEQFKWCVVHQILFKKVVVIRLDYQPLFGKMSCHPWCFIVLGSNEYWLFHLLRETCQKFSAIFYNYSFNCVNYLICKQLSSLLVKSRWREST